MGKSIGKDKTPIAVTRSSLPEFEEYVQEIAPLWKSHWLTNMGDKHCEFERQLEKYLGVKNVTLYTNGHSALECALEALDLRGKVITTPFTFASTTHAIVRKGLTPVFADIRADNYTINSELVEELIDEETVAILPVHVYGSVCDVDAIQAIADKYNLKVIYDAAHAFAVKKNGVSVAAFGDISMFSFHATKVFNTIEGGALVFKDGSLLNRLNQLKNFGITGLESVDYAGSNAKMNEFCAAMGICNLRHIDENIARRKHLFALYHENLGDIRGVRLLSVPDNIESNYAYMPVVFEDDFGATRDEVYETLAKEGIRSRKYFYPLVTDFACYKSDYDSNETPQAKHVASRVLTLPLYADLSALDVHRICKIVRECSL